MPISGRKVERRALILLLEVGVTARSKKLICDGRLPILGLDEQLCGPMRVLLVDEGLRALCRQQRANLRCITITRGSPKLLPRHSFPTPSLCFSSLFPWNLYILSVRPTH